MADRFMKGTLILTAAGLLVKILGSVNRILLSRLLGGEGIGLYQIAYPLYLLLVALSSAGIPAAMSIVISRRAAAGDRQLSPLSPVLPGDAHPPYHCRAHGPGWGVFCRTGLVPDPLAH